MATFTWANGTSGDWGLGTNWMPTTGAPPDASDAAATINASGIYKVSIQNNETETANTVNLDAAGATLDVQGGGALNLAGATSPAVVVNAGTFDLEGTLTGGTVQVSGGTFLLNGDSGAELSGSTVQELGGTVQFEQQDINNFGPILDDVTWQGPLVVPSNPNLSLNIEGGLAVETATGGLPGTIDMTAGGGAAILVLDGETLNNATLNFGSVGGDFLYNFDQNMVGDTLTLGSGFRIAESGGVNSIINEDPAGVTDVILNAGSIDVTGGILRIENGEFTNTGTIMVSGGTLDMESFSAVLINNGSIVVGSGGDVQLNSIDAGTGTVTIDSGGTLDLNLTATSAASVTFGTTGGLLAIEQATYTGTVYNITGNDRIYLPFLNTTTSATTAKVLHDNMLQVVQSTTTYDIQLDPTQNFTQTGTNFQVGTVAAGGIDVTPCFVAGTRIATPRGEVPVERLKIGDMVLTARGDSRPIVWIGVGHVAATPGRRSAATPVIVRKGALTDGVPYRDLHITRGHSLFINGVLVPVEFLVNQRSIVWDDRAHAVSIYHVELETHDVLVADGALAESYRDDGNRWLFRNGTIGRNITPQEPCAPVLTGGPLVDTIWHRLRERAEPHGTIPTTDEHDLHLIVDGQRIDGDGRPGGVYVFRVGTVDNVRILSRSAVPAELGMARDPRRLGVALRQIRVFRGSRLQLIEASNPLLEEGFHSYEADNSFRWTNGDAAIPNALFAGLSGPLEIVLHLGCVARYGLSGADAVKAA